LILLDQESRLIEVNRAFRRTFHLSQAECEGKMLYSLSQGGWDCPGFRVSIDDLVRSGVSFADCEIEVDLRGVGRKALVSGGCRVDRPNTFLVWFDDVTGRRNTEWAARLESERAFEAGSTAAIERLAGGVAHEINNLLASIIGHSSLLLKMLDGDGQAAQQVLSIRTAGDRAASFTQQLLAFARCQTLQLEVLNLNSVVSGIEEILRNLAGERITVVVDRAPDLQQVRVDRDETIRAILNLFLTAKEAMQEGAGTVTIRTANLHVTEEVARQEGLAAGCFVTLAMHDTAAAMDTETRTRIFEPFIDVRRLGSGSGLGLGLAAVLGFVEQSGGTIRCVSEPQLGTTFTIFFPTLSDRPDEQTLRFPARTAGTEMSRMVLLVDDEETIRTLVRAILEDEGYGVLEARNGREGLALCEATEGPIDLLLTDVMMPEIGGTELAESALKMRPGMGVLFMSGYADLTHRERLGHPAMLLRKPFTAFELTRKVREVLDGNKAPGSSC
jgi:signal transduction histidine kinase/CheY-like chemotaxis protein